MKYILSFRAIKWNFNNFISFVLFAFLFGSCTTGVELTPLRFDAFLHDSNSKIWVVDQLWTKDGNHAQPELLKKDAVIFYEDGTCYIMKVSDIGSEKFDRFSYQFIEKAQQQLLLLEWKGKKITFKLNVFSNGDLRLKPLNTSKFKYTMVLIPFPNY